MEHRALTCPSNSSPHGVPRPPGGRNRKGHFPKACSPSPSCLTKTNGRKSSGWHLACTPPFRRQADTTGLVSRDLSIRPCSPQRHLRKNTQRNQNPSSSCVFEAAARLRLLAAIWWPRLSRAARASLKQEHKHGRLRLRSKTRARGDRISLMKTAFRCCNSENQSCCCCWCHPPPQQKLFHFQNSVARPAFAGVGPQTLNLNAFTGQVGVGVKPAREESDVSSSDLSSLTELSRNLIPPKCLRRLVGSCLDLSPDTTLQWRSIQKPLAGAPRHSTIGLQ